MALNIKARIAIGAVSSNVMLAEGSGTIKNLNSSSITDFTLCSHGDNGGLMDVLGICKKSYLLERIYKTKKSRDRH